MKTNKNLIKICGFLGFAVLALPVSAQYVSTLVEPGLLSQPWGLVAVSNSLYISDTSHNRIVEYGITGASTNYLGAGVLSAPMGIVAARGGLVVVDQNNQVIRFISLSGAVSTLAGSFGNANYGDGIGTNAFFSYPDGITADAAGNLYVADTYNGLIRKIDTNNVVTTVATGGYQFNNPVAVAFDGSSNLWVADNVNNVICLVSNPIVSSSAATVVAGGGLAGGQFSAPSGLLWDSLNNRLLIADSGDAVVSALTSSSNGYAVQTVAGIMDVSSFIDGPIGTATFNYPVGMAVDSYDVGFYVADFNNDAVRVLQPSAPQPPVTAPVLGYVTFPGTANPPNTSIFNASTDATFQTLVPIAIEAEGGTQTLISYGPTGTTIPTPSSGSTQALPYPGNGNNAPIQSAVQRGDGTNDITIYAIGEAAGRKPSAVVSGRYIFVTANPQIIGSDASDIQVQDATPNATIFFTTDGSTPSNDGSSGLGVASGSYLPLNITSNVILNVRAFADSLGASEVVSEALFASNNIGNQMSFGFKNGVGSSKFVVGAGRNFFAPVTLSLVGTPNIYSMQFDVSLTSAQGDNWTDLSPSFWTLLYNQPTGNPPILLPIDPGIAASTNGSSTGVTIATNSGFAEVAWIEAYGMTNVYNSLIQHLTEYSFAGYNEIYDSAEQVVVGAWSFAVPSGAANGSTYSVQLNRPSASSFSGSIVPLPVILQTPTNGSMTAGAINSIKTVTVTNVSYLVGDVFPMNWYNAGDFGDGTILNDDVIVTFNAAVDYLDEPLPGSDWFDAMDSCNGNFNQLWDGDDLDINSITTGDGVLDVSDVYVTLERSLNSNLFNVYRTWNNGVMTPYLSNNVAQSNLKPALSSKTTQSSATHAITVAADQIQSGASRTVQVPVRVLAADSLPLRVLLLNVEVDALDGSPAITNTLSFTPASGLSSSAYVLNASLGVNSYGAAWLDSTVAGISGTNIIGTLSITLPPNLNTNAAYRVHFNRFSASPNGIATFKSTIQDGLITVGNRSGSSWNDGIPDSWRLLNFGTVSNILSAANADPDGDGASNWQEYVAGTNPNDPTSVFEFQAATAPVSGTFTLQWPSVVNKSYTVQSSATLGGGWVTLTNLSGTGQTMQWSDIQASGGGKFYRATVH